MNKLIPAAAETPAGEELPDAKAWMIENVGPVPQDDEEVRDKWHAQLGVLVHYKLDIESLALLPASPPSAELRDIAGEVWDFLIPYLPLGNRTDLYDKMREKFPAALARLPLTCTCPECNAHDQAVRERAERSETP
jgi:hypothetical protein